MTLDGRTMKRKSVRIGPAPEEDQADTRPHVEIPVLITMPLVGTNGQIFNYRILNTSENQSRQVTTKTVKAALFDSDNQEIHYGSPEIDVERLHVGRFIGTNGQIFNKRLWNDDPAPRTPEAAAGLQQDDIGHYKVHYVRYYAGNNDETGTWIEVEYIDRLRIVGTNGQIYNFKFRCPDAEYFQQFGETPSGNKTFGDPIEDDSDPYNQDPDKPVILGFCDPSLETLQEEAGSSIDPPWRLDPLTNVVNLSSVLASFYFPYEVDFYSDMFGGPGAHWFRPGAVNRADYDITSVAGQNAYAAALATAPQYPNTFTGTMNIGGVDKPYVYTGVPTVPDVKDLTSQPEFIGQPVGPYPSGPKWFKSDGPAASISEAVTMYGLYNFLLGVDWALTTTAHFSWATPTLTVDGVPWRVKNMTMLIYFNPPYRVQDGVEVISGGIPSATVPSFVVTFEP